MAPASRSASAAGGGRSLRGGGRATLGDKAESPSDHAAHGDTSLGMFRKRSILHALLNLKGHGLFARLAWNRLVEIGRHGWKMVRDAGFEHVAPNWEQFQKKDPVRSNGAL